MLNMYNDVHASTLEEMHSALAHIFNVCGAGGDDVDDAENSLLVLCMVVIVVVIMRMRVVVVVVCVRMGMGMAVSMCRFVGVRVGVVVRIRVSMVACMLIVAMFVLFFVSTVFFFGMRFRVCRACVFEPKFGHGVAHDSSQTA